MAKSNKKKIVVPTVKRMAGGGPLDNKIERGFQQAEDVASIIPVVGLGRSISEGVAGMFGDSGFGTFMSGMIDPQSSTVNGIKDIAKGDIGLDTVMDFLLPGVGKLMDKKEEKKMMADKMNNNIILPRTVGRENMTPNVMHFKKGGSLSASKASEILKDGTVHGKKLTAKQRKFMQAVAHGMTPYEQGGMMEQDMMQPGMNYSEIEGPKHEQGGVQFMQNAELEGGENVENGVVNSDAIKITPEIAELYGLPKKAVNKTVAGYRKSIEKKYEGRDGDPFAMKSKEIETNNISKMSAELGEISKRMNNQYHEGGGLPPHSHQYGSAFIRPHTMEAYVDSNGLMWQPYKNNVGQIKRRLIDQRLFADADTPTIDYEQKEQVLQSPSIPTLFDYRNKINSSNYGLNPISRINRPEYGTGISLPDKKGNVVVPQVTKPQSTEPVSIGEDAYLLERMKEKNGLISPVRTTRPVGGFDLKGADSLRPGPKTGTATPTIKGTTPGKGNLLGLVPIALGALNAARAASDKPDKVNLPRLHAEDVNVRLIDPRYQLEQVGDTFATANNQMDQVSRKDFLRRRIQSATEESKAKSGILGQVTAANNQLLNRAEEINKQDRARVNTVNAELALQEENLNAANEGTWETNRDFQLNNLGSMIGEYARDKRLEGADERYRQRWLNTMNNMFAGQTYNPETGEFITTGTAGLPVNNKNVYSTDVRITGNKVNATNPEVSFNPSDLIEDPLYTRYGGHGQFRVPRANLGILRSNYLTR